MTLKDKTFGHGKIGISHLNQVHQGKYEQHLLNEP